MSSGLSYVHSKLMDDPIAMIAAYIQTSRQKYPIHYKKLHNLGLTEPFNQMLAANDLMMDIKTDAGNWDVVTAHDGRGHLAGFALGHQYTPYAYSINYLCSLGDEDEPEETSKELLEKILGIVPEECTNIYAIATKESKAIYKKHEPLAVFSPYGSGDKIGRRATREEFTANQRSFSSDMDLLMLPNDAVVEKIRQIKRKWG